MKNKSAFCLFFLFVFSALLIFFKFTAIPKFLAYDEVEFTKLALSLGGKPYTPYSSLATGHSTLYFYILLLSLKMFGINTFALRLPAAVFGVLSVVVFYLVVKTIFRQKYLPFILTVLFLTSRWFINFSRFAFEATFLLFLELTSIYFFLKAKSNIYLIISGLLAGLAYNSYTPGRIFFILPLSFFVIKLVSSLIHKQFKTETLKRFFIFFIPFLITITPLTLALSNSKETRIDQLFFWRNHEMTIGQKTNGTIQNFVSITSMFFLKGDMNGKHNYPGKPALNPILGFLFVVGFIASLKKWRTKENQLFLIFLFLSLAPSVPIYPWENPSMLRTFTVIPSLVYFIGIAISFISKKANSKYLYLVLLLLALSSFYELRTYFKYQKTVFEQSFEIKYPLEKAVKMANPYEKSP